MHSRVSNWNKTHTHGLVVSFLSSQICQDTSANIKLHLSGCQNITSLTS